MIYSEERLVPDQFGMQDRILIEHLDRYRFASRSIAEHLVWRDRQAQNPNGRARLRMLDAPCGAGYGAALLAEQHMAEVVGLDYDSETIRYAASRYASVDGVDFKVANLDTDDLEKGVFDVVTCFEGIEHVQQQYVVAEKLCHALKLNGLLLVSTPRAGGPGAGSPFHTNELLRVQLYNMFAQHLPSVRMYGQDMTVGDCAPDDNARFYVLVGIR